MPWAGLIVAGAGLAQTIIAGQRAKKAREAVENAKVPIAQPDQSISRYYNEALKRYNTAPTSTAMYKNALFNINRNQAAGLNALKDRRSLIGGVSSIVGRSNDASIRAAAQAESDQNLKFNQLGGATSRKSADTRYLFGQNEMSPYQKSLTLAEMKAAANTQTANTGIQNIYSGLSNYAMMKNGTYGSGQNYANGGGADGSYYNLVTSPNGTYTGN